MANLVDLNKKCNHRWKTNPTFVRGFDYDHPIYDGVPADLKWMLPMREQQQSPLIWKYHADMGAKVSAQIESERPQERLKAFKKLSEY